MCSSRLLSRLVSSRLFFRLVSSHLLSRLLSRLVSSRLFFRLVSSHLLSRLFSSSLVYSHLGLSRLLSRFIPCLVFFLVSCPVSSRLLFRLFRRLVLSCLVLSRHLSCLVSFCHVIRLYGFRWATFRHFWRRLFKSSTRGKLALCQPLLGNLKMWFFKGYLTIG